MGVGVVADDVAARGRLLEEVRHSRACFPIMKKSGAGFEKIEKIQQLRRDRGIGPIVKRERELARGIGAANRSAE